MGEGMQTGHRVFRGGNRIELEVTAAKPFVIEQPGGSRQEAPAMADDPAITPAESGATGTAADVAASIAGARSQEHEHIMELARSQQEESESE